RRLTDAPGRDFAPAWSPDGKRIAFVADRSVSFRDRLEGDPDLDIWFMNADGTDQHLVTKNQGTDRCVSWSPDGHCIIYSASRGCALVARRVDDPARAARHLMVHSSIRDNCGHAAPASLQ